jgi:DNA-binding XRE family transcriptional regulator
MMQFGDWLLDQLRQRDMRPADLGRVTGLESSVMSNLINHRRHPAIETCKTISRALGIPLEDVYRAAGYLPPKPESNPVINTILHLVSELDDRDREDVLEYVRLRWKLSVERDNNRKTAKGSSKRPATT